jgi:hypothetical protein
MLAAQGGDADELAEWLAQHWPEIAASAELDARGDPKLLAAAVKRVAHARWRTYLAGDRPLRGIAAEREKQRKREAFEAAHGASNRQIALEEAAG